MRYNFDHRIEKWISFRLKKPQNTYIDEKFAVLRYLSQISHQFSHEPTGSWF